MNFLIVTHAPHKKIDTQVYSYAPYVREMNLWTKNVSSTTIVTPVIDKPIDKIDLSYDDEVRIKKIPALGFTSWGFGLKSLLNLPVIFWVLFTQMRKADHIHLRCPGTIGLAGCVMQMAFPKKKKTAKYAGNWDPEAVQPLSYRLQKWILSNTFLTRNMQVLVYGDWPNQTKNICPFFTATYWEHAKAAVTKRDYKGKLEFLFVGSLVPGKQPLYAIKLVENLVKKRVDVSLTLYGDGVLRKELEQYVEENSLDAAIQFMGNQPSGVVTSAYKQAHFLLLASNSEGWPKVVAEAMFWGAIPVSTPVSCVAWMLDYGKRGILLKNDLDNDTSDLLSTLNNKDELELMSNCAVQWSRQYTLDSFENAIKELL